MATMRQGTPGKIRARLAEHVSHFELRLEEGVVEGGHLTDGKITLYSEIWIDGECVSEPQQVDVPWLINSLVRPGHYDFMACGCGLEEDGRRWCGYTFAGIDVAHEGYFIRWRFRLPQFDYEPEELDTSWVGPLEMREHVFRRAQVEDAVRNYMQAVRALVQGKPGDFDWPIAGYTVEELLERDLKAYWQPSHWKPKSGA